MLIFRFSGESCLFFHGIEHDFAEALARKVP
nr:MAG TPA: hypothetical protein [Caudoviricetes sp.]